MRLFKALLKTLCGLSVLFAGCTGAELSESKNVTLQFRYTADGTTDVLPEYIGSVTLYVYDSKTGQFIKSAKIDNTDLLKYQSANLMLDPGTYDIVCWGNVKDNTTFNNTFAGESEAALTNPYCNTTQKVTTNDPLYYGKTTLNVSSNLYETSGTVDFCCAHIDIWVYVKGITDKSSSGENIPPIVTVSNLLPAYNFSMQPQGDSISYYPESAYRQDKLVSMAHCSVLRFTEDTPAQINIYKGSNGELIEAVSISKFITDNKISVSGKEEVSIQLLLEYSALGVVIRIPQWDEVSATPEW